MIFRQFFDAKSSTYTYLLADEGSREAVLIDPVKDQLEQYMQIIKELDVNLVKALDTHTHADHVTALGDLRDRTDCITIMGEHTGAACVSEKVRDGDVISVGNLQLTAWDTPGHTDESFCFVMNDRVFTGDTLLIRGCGRTDFQAGDPYKQYDSIQRLLSLPDETLVYPGHDYKGWTASTIGEEKAHNPRLQVNSADEFAEIMNNLNLPDPTQMDVAIPANLACGQPVAL